MHVSVLGIDFGKNNCSFVERDATRKVVVRRSMRRVTVIAYAGALSPFIVAM